MPGTREKGQTSFKDTKDPKSLGIVPHMCQSLVQSISIFPYFRLELRDSVMFKEMMKESVAYVV